ncbi:hypothetical protein [Porcipelethomonas sp.]|uniref:hypothetical protein n=1 Tax=Porcipelethomonas sp. TaxID=2981675 RepID=UPI003EF21B9D
MKRKICIMISLAVFAAGIFMMLTRGNPLDKSIGTVIITNGKERLEVPGYTVSYNTDSKIKEVEHPEMSDVLSDLPDIDYNSDGEGGISVSYSDKFTDVSYSVYDENMKPVAENQSSLKLSGSESTKYYVEILVNWGSKKENVAVKYYFIINIV